MKFIIKNCAAIVVFLCFAAQTAAVAQVILTIDEAVSETMHYASEKLPNGARVSVLHVETANKELTDYITVECENYIQNNTLLRLADRRKLASVLRGKEQNYLSTLDEDELLEIGKIMGADFVILGEFSKRGEFYRFVIQILDVETAEIKGMQSTRVKLDEILADFVGHTFTPLAAATITEPPAKDDSQDEMRRVRMELEELKHAINAQQTAAPTTEPTNTTPQKRSRLVWSPKFMITGDVGSGFEIEFGGIRKDKQIFSGTAMFAEGRIGVGGGGGFNITPYVVSAKEVFKFAPSMTFGFWYFDFEETGWRYDYNVMYVFSYYNNAGYYWGGPDFRFMVGWRYVYFNYNLRLLFGMKDHYNEYEGYYDFKFSTRAQMGLGATFLIGKRY